MTCQWFSFKNIKSTTDMNCFIDQELKEVAPLPIIESKKVRGRNKRLHKSLGDYDAFNYPIEVQIADFKQLEEVKRWLTGTGQLILSSSSDKYREATVVDSGTPIQFTNEMGAFWTFTIVFECEPLKHKVRQPPIELAIGNNLIIDHGTELSEPRFTFQSSGGDIRIEWEGGGFLLKDTRVGEVVVDCEKGLAYHNGETLVKTQGEWPKILPGENNIEVNMVGEVLLRSSWR